MCPEAQINFHKHVCLIGCTNVKENQSLPPQISSSPLFVSTGQGVGLFMSTVDEKTFFWSLTYHSEEKRPPPHTGTAMSKEQQEEFVNEVLTRSGGGLSEEFRSYVRECDRERILVVNCQDKFPHPNPSEQHVLFIGDALHPMSPLGGNGANMAIMDGVEFVELLIKNSMSGAEIGDLVATTIREFDLHHTQRSVNAIKFSHRNIAIAESVGLGHQIRKFVMTMVAFVKNKY